MSNKILCFALLTLTLVGCGNSESQQKTAPEKAAKTDDTSLLCPAILDNNLATLCTINAGNHTVDAMIESFDDEVARQTCDTISGKLKPMTADFSGAWKLEIMSPYRSDKPTASCALH